MGQTESSIKAHKPRTPPDADGLRRQDYINRLGIQKNRKIASFSHVPTIHYEDPGQFESKAKYGSFTNGSFHFPTTYQTTYGPSEPSLKTPAESEENEDTEVADVTDAQVKCLDLKRQEDFRVSYLRKLSYEKVWVPAAQRPPKHQTVIIFDWDDTLLCTSYLNQRADRPVHPSVENHLRAIEKNVKDLLERALKLGNTFIITNAMEGWVEYSAGKYVPGLLPVLEKVRIISARTRYETLYPCDVNKWKINAFLDVQRQLDSQVVTNLNSLGDSEYEMDATHIMGKEFAQALIKTVKFKQSPSPEELLKQLELVSERFEQIVDNARNMKLGLERKTI